MKKMQVPHFSMKKASNMPTLKCMHVVFFFCKGHPYLGATPYNVFTCSCCGSSCTEYKCPYSTKDLTIEEGWEKTDFLEIDEKLRLKRSHKYHFKVKSQMGICGYKITFFVVWTCKGKPHIEVIVFDNVFWRDILSILIVFFKSYVQRVLLHFRPICYCFFCSKPCLEPEEFDDEEENSVQCQSCSLWCHWACTGSAVNLHAGFVFQSCSMLALDDMLRFFGNIKQS